MKHYEYYRIKEYLGKFYIEVYTEKIGLFKIHKKWKRVDTNLMPFFCYDQQTPLPALNSKEEAELLIDQLKKGVVYHYYYNFLKNEE
jgi:hypothetical protein